MTFKEFNNLLKSNFSKMEKLYVSSISGNQVVDTYLSSFDNDPVFRDPESSAHNCNHCKNFLRRYGNIVSIQDDKLVSMYCGIEEAGEYTKFVKTMSNLLTTSEIENVFLEEENIIKTSYGKPKNGYYRAGIESNVKVYTQEEADKFGVVASGEVRTFNHFHIDIPEQYVSYNTATKLSDKKSARDVFERGLTEIKIDTIDLIIDLIHQGSIINSDHLIDTLKNYKKAIQSYTKYYTWENIDCPLARFRNTLLGTLCVELSEGKDINKSCEDYNKRIDPINYKKAKSPITKRQIEEAKKFLIEQDIEESFNRRIAKMTDIDVSQIKHINEGDGKAPKVSILDTIKTTSTMHKRAKFDKVEEISIEKFMKDILPTCSSVEIMFENRLENNLVCMTTAEKKDSKRIFNWDNNFSWTYKGNLAGKSLIKQAVKSRGGNTEGVLNIRLAFPDTTDDYDLHVKEPFKHIYFGNVRRKHNSSGMLDLDAQGVDGFQTPENRVENIIYTDKNDMPKGTYIVYVNNYSGRGFNVPFTMEIEIEGQVTILKSKKSNSNNLNCAKINYNGDEFKLDIDKAMEIVDSKHISKNIWGIDTNNFYEVELVCYSPNHWDKSIGNLHYFFMIKDCNPDKSIRTFHNENLLPELLKHRKVFEILGQTVKVEGKGLTGLGFNSTVRDEVIVRCKGNFNRMLKVKF